MLLVAGDTHDMRAEHLLEARASLRLAQLWILPKASHFLLQEKPLLLLPIVLAFLAPEVEEKGAPGASEQAPPAPASPAARSVALPFSMDHNRVLVDVDFVRGDGALRTARSWVDTGNSTLVLGAALARDLGLETAPSEPPTLWSLAREQRRWWWTRPRVFRLAAETFPDSVDGSWGLGKARLAEGP